ncbi:AAA family ATPase [Caulobacter segnis]|uniref:ATP-dependent nuclease n=1 Tax=Caulobacter segnis TaxID=88688 RepID=UPI0028612BF6|nr:AAA family ATPase [Caulobacter segnis]MDR6624844.1 putative ATPase [Caulobacter segnis]
MITKIYIENFKGFRAFEMDLNDDLNIIVGNNEAGKSSILEAIGLVLTKRIGGRLLEGELAAFLFNKKVVDEYLGRIWKGERPPLPRIAIEAYLAETEAVSAFRGSHNHEKSDAIGVRLEVAFNDEFASDYGALLAHPAEIKALPTEFYTVHWRTFGGAPLTPRGMPLGLSYIDATAIRLQSGTDFYLQSIINSGMEAKERAALSVAYRGLKEKFADEAAIKAINEKLTQRKGAITDKDLAIGIDVSQKSNWEASLIPHLDDLPFHLIGKGEQSALKIMLALERQASDAHIILIEEPENHLSFSSMQKLIAKIQEKCKGKQIILTTHSAYVLNKLGMEKTILLHNGSTTSLNRLPPETEKYFKKLSGYDTLRIILAERSILVEGPSDELIVQRAYRAKHGHPPADDGVDIINVRGLSFPRFLDIAKELGKSVCVVTDNDGDYQGKIVERYRPYDDCKTIAIHADADEDARTLELQIVKCNKLEILNKILGTAHADKTALGEFMVKNENKTESALKIFESDEEIVYPKYIQDAL